LCFVSLYFNYGMRKALCASQSQRGGAAGVSQPFRLGVETLMGPTIRSCVVLGEVYCNTFMVRTTRQEGGPCHCQGPHTFCVCSKYVHFIPAHTHTATPLRTLFQCTACTLSAIHTYGRRQPRLCTAEYALTNLDYLMCTIPTVLIQYVTLKQTIHTRHYYSNPKSCMFRLHTAAIIRLYV
jgi:hypothetical protein